MRKGDVLAVARVAGIMALKRTSDIIPLCHPAVGVEGARVWVELVGPDTTSDAVVSPKGGATDEAGSTVSFLTLLEDHLLRPIGRHGGLRIAATAECSGKTGVEMEALAGVVGAGLTVVDMCKGVDKGLVLEGARVVMKEGGRSGAWRGEGFK